MSLRPHTSSDAYSFEIEDEQLIVRAFGRWDLHTVKEIDVALKADLEALGYGYADVDMAETGYIQIIFDFADLTRMDTAGAFILTRTIGCHDGFCRRWCVRNATDGQKGLVYAAAEAAEGMAPLKPRPWYSPLETLGKASVRALSETYDTIAFLGQFMMVMAKVILNPRRVRWKSVTSLIETVGLDAVPIVMTLSFFIGAVIAFMGSDLLQSFGAKIFMVDLVGIAVLREFAVLITAILLAGRSNSAFTAQIGSMKMRQEIDAMVVIGMSKEEVLVAPRAIACLVAMPILTFAAMIAGLGGGLLVAWSQDISPVLFLARLKEVVPLNHFWVGMIKAPVFALVIAVIGCRQGFAVGGSVESLGARTTTSVVQAIFTVIVLDAMFAMLFLRLGM
ncbi:MAG: ABC transporter permease [Robiginitomaculum sp.]|nr:MAG: ABC transporter permease [Robiginitomaculum sp.]